jgi:hypothetical protein
MSEPHRVWLVDANAMASQCVWWDAQRSRQLTLAVKAVTANPTQSAHLTQAPQTPTEGYPAANAPRAQPQGGTLQKIFTMLQRNCEGQNSLMQKLEESKEATAALKDSLNTKVSTLEATVDDQAWKLEQQQSDVGKLRESQDQNVDAIQNVQSHCEVNCDAITKMQEQLFRLENQVANPAPEVHYHDNRTVIVIGGIGKYHIEEATEALPVLWYNFHGHPTGSTTRKVYLPPQKPRKHPQSGEYMVDLVEHTGRNTEVWEAVYTKYLTFASNVSKRQRRG